MSARRPPISAARARLVALLVAVVSAVGVSGCGQAQQVRGALDYSADVSRVLTRFGDNQRQVLEQSRDAKVPADVDRALQRLSGFVDGVQGDLRSVGPPATVAGLHRDLIATYSRWVEPITQLQRVVRTRKARTIQRGQREFTLEINALQRTIDATLVRINTKLRRLSD